MTQAGPYLAKTTKTLPLREKANSEQRPFCSIPKGTLVTIIQKTDGWYLVSSGVCRIGFTNQRSFKRVKDGIVKNLNSLDAKLDAAIQTASAL